MRGSASNDVIVNEYLHSLDQPGWPFAARLYCSQIANVDRTTLKLFREQVCGRDCVLNSEVDSDAACR